MTYYQFWAHQSGDVWAVRLEEGEVVTGTCGPLADDDREGPLPDYHYHSDDNDWMTEHADEFRLWEP